MARHARTSNAARLAAIGAALVVTSCGVYRAALLDATAQDAPSADVTQLSDSAADSRIQDAGIDAIDAIDALGDVPVRDDVQDATTDAYDSGCGDCPLPRACCMGSCVDPQSDAMHCGRCGTACPNTTCSSGLCTNTCRLGFGDCDANATNGCETDLASSASHCGRCGTPCAPANADGTCTSGRCVFVGCHAGFADCNMNPADGCEANLMTSAMHCAACGMACTIPGAMAMCMAGVCTRTSCSMGRGDCDGDTVNGCETDVTASTMHCGACGAMCTLPNATAGCTASLCSVGSCAMGFGDCDRLAGNGCEVNLRSNSMNCGMCGQVCAFANATAACTMGACALGACSANFGNCDAMAANGCETDTRTSVAHCGMCGRACALPNATASCVAGACAVATCTAGFGNCDAMAANGCEANLATNAANCGVCGRVCAAGAMCAAGVCVPPRRVFVTSTLYSPTLGGLAGGDARCQARAVAGGLSGTWRAWLADATGSPSTRFTRSGGAYQLLNGVTIALNWADLTDGTLLAPINLTELRGPPPTPNPFILSEPTVWTGANANGTAVAGDNCVNWTSADTTTSHVVTEGRSDRADATWSLSRTWSGGPCSWQRPLYCFEQ